MISSGYVKRKGNILDTLDNYFKDLSKKEVRAGFFSEMGEHPSERNTQGWSYAQLMAFHELQIDFSKRRPLFQIASKNVPVMLRKHFKKGLVSSVESSKKGSKKDSQELSEEIGNLLVKELEKVFGKSPPLKANAVSTQKMKGNKNTPLIETGSLKDGLRYKTSKNDVMRKGTL